MKRKIAVVMALVVAMTSLAACGGKEEPAAAEPSVGRVSWPVRSVPAARLKRRRQKAEKKRQQASLPIRVN